MKAGPGSGRFKYFYATIDLQAGVLDRCAPCSIAWIFLGEIRELKVSLLQRKEFGNLVLHTSWQIQCAARAARSDPSISCGSVALVGLGALMWFRID